MSKHSIYAPSKSERWINCPASIRVTKHFKDSSSPEALEGTAAHWLFEHCMNNSVDPEQFRGNSLTATSDDGALKKQFEIDDDFVDGVGLMVNYCRQVMQAPGVTSVESRLDLTHIEAGFFGSGDFVHDSSAHDGVLTVVDLKYGFVPVEIDRNTQTLCYGAGALNTPAVCKAPAQVKWLRLVIVQPRGFTGGPKIKETIIPVEDIRRFEQTLANAIAQTKLVNPKIAHGKWCTYCPALGVCPATTSLMDILALTLSIEPKTASDAQLSALFQSEKLIDQVIKRAKEETEKRLLAGRTMPNLFLATSTTHRKWHNEKAALAALKDEVGEKALRIKTPAQVEKLGGEAKSLVLKLASSAPGKPVAAVVGDKRKPFTTRSAAEIFKA